MSSARHRPRRPVALAVGEGVASFLGQVAGQVLGAAAAVRRSKPIHPRGVLHAGRLRRHGGGGTGVPLLDDPGTSECVVRVSRSVGLPPPLPDVHGVAVRLEEAGHLVDLLFATTGTGRISRYVLLPRRSPRAPMTTIMPLRTSAGALQLLLTPDVLAEDSQGWELSVSTPSRRTWQPVGRLTAGTGPAGPEEDPPLRFDPVRHLADGAAVDRWIRLVREPAYVLSRRRWPAGAAAPGARTTAGVVR